MILCIGPTPAMQRVMVFDGLAIGDVNRAAKTFDGIAGKAINVAKVLNTLREEPFAVGFLGGTKGEEIQRTLRDRGIEHEFVWVPANTRQCVTVIDNRAGAQTELVEESQAVPENKYEDLLRIVERRAASCKAVVMSGTLTPGAPVNFYRKCIEELKQRSLLTILDAKGEPLQQALPARPALVKPNRAELSATVGRELSGERELMQAVRELHERGAQRVVVTAGREAALAFDGKGFWRVSSPAIKPINPIGSGDSFTAAMTSRLLRGDDLGEACRWGAAAGAANALTWMAAELEAKEVERLTAEVRLEKVSPG